MAGNPPKKRKPSPLEKGPRLETGSLQVRQDTTVFGGVVFNRGQQRRTVSLSTITIGAPHACDMHGGSPDVPVGSTYNLAILVSQKGRHRARPLVTNDGDVKGSHSIDYLPQLIDGRVPVKLKGHIGHAQTSNEGSSEAVLSTSLISESMAFFQ